MSYIVRVRRSRKRIRQRYYVTIQAGNGKPIFVSEMLTNRAYALELAQLATEAFDGNLVNET